MSEVIHKKVRSEPKRIYEDIGGFELRYGKFYNYNPHLDPTKFEIRILHQDPELLMMLNEKIKEWLMEK